MTDNEKIEKIEELSTADNFNKNLTNSVVRMIGDKITICQVIQLLAYVRHAIREDKPIDIHLKIGHKIAGGEFLFDVNQQDVPDYITQEEIEIN